MTPKRTLDIDKRYRAFRVRYLGPGNVRGARVAIKDTRRNEQVVVRYNYGMNGAAEVALEYLAGRGIAITAMVCGHADPDCLLLTEDFATPLRGPAGERNGLVAVAKGGGL